MTKQLRCPAVALQHIEKTPKKHTFSLFGCIKRAAGHGDMMKMPSHDKLILKHSTTKKKSGLRVEVRWLEVDASNASTESHVRQETCCREVDGKYVPFGWRCLLSHISCAGWDDADWHLQRRALSAACLKTGHEFFRMLLCLFAALVTRRFSAWAIFFPSHTDTKCDTFYSIINIYIPLMSPQ